MSRDLPELLTRPRPLALQAKLFRGLSDHSRLSILETLRAGPLTVGEIVSATALASRTPQTTCAALASAALSKGEQRGRFVRYRLSDPRISRLLAMADELLAEVAHGLDDCQNYRG